MFQDALFVPDRNFRAKGAALPGAALVPAVVTPDGIVEEGFGVEGVEGGIEGGLDYGADGGFPRNFIGNMLYTIIGEPAEPVVRAAGDIRARRLVRKVEPDYPEIARQARGEGGGILGGTTDGYAA